jgi:hypothetical protein
MLLNEVINYSTFCYSIQKFDQIEIKHWSHSNKIKSTNKLVIKHSFYYYLLGEDNYYRYCQELGFIKSVPICLSKEVCLINLKSSSFYSDIIINLATVVKYEQVSSKSTLLTYPKNLTIEINLSLTRFETLLAKKLIIERSLISKQNSDTFNNILR